VHNIALYLLTVGIMSLKMAKASKSHVAVANGYANKCRQCKRSINSLASATTRAAQYLLEGNLKVA
jgi:hypothetical protein